EFTFNHLQQLFELMRANTLFFFLLSVVLTFLLAAKLTNRYAACVAATLLVLNPAYCTYSSFIRVESIAICFLLSSVLVLIHTWNKRVESRAEAPFLSR